MTDIMSHDQVEQLLPAAALEILEGDELILVTAHLRECAGCARLLDSYCEAVALLGTTLPERPLRAAHSERLRARLLARASADPAPAAAGPRSARAAIDRWLGWAVAAGLAGVLLVHHSIHRPIANGWLVAGVVIVLATGLGVYSWIQRARVAALKDKLSQLLDQSRQKGEPPGTTVR